MTATSARHSITFLGLHIVLAPGTHDPADGGLDFVGLRVSGRGMLDLPDDKVRALAEKAIGSASFGHAGPAVLDALADAFRRPLIATRHQGLIDHLRRTFPEARNYEVSPRAKADDVRGRVVIGVLPSHLAALALVHVEIPLDMTLVPKGAELDADEVARIAGPPRFYSVQGL